MHTYVLEREQIIPRSKEETFSFFSDAFNLERITPPFLKFRIVTPRPIEMRAGRIIDYRLSLYGIPFRWRTMIETWTPDERFVDTQLCGPYNLWHHTHTFEALDANRTLMRDVVLYRVPYGPLGRIANWLFVAAALKGIFNYRARMTAQLLGGDVAESLSASPFRSMSAAAGD